LSNNPARAFLINIYFFYILYNFKPIFSENIGYKQPERIFFKIFCYNVCCFGFFCIILGRILENRVWKLKKGGFLGVDKPKVEKQDH
jgi:hypothetical protein